MQATDQPTILRFAGRMIIAPSAVSATTYANARGPQIGRTSTVRKRVPASPASTIPDRPSRISNVTDTNRSSDRQSYKCQWRTVSTKPELANHGEVTVEARCVIDAIAVAKQKIHEQTKLGTKDIVVYEVEDV
jgi:hypothetical protein